MTTLRNLVGLLFLALAPSGFGQGVRSSHPEWLRYASEVNSPLVAVLAGQPPKSVPSVMKLWLNREGRADKVQLLDGSQDAMSLPAVTKAVLKLKFAAPPADMPMPIVIRIKTGRPATESYAQAIQRQVMAVVASLPPASLPPVFSLRLWLNAGGRASKAELQDVFHNGFSHPPLAEALRAGVFSPPPVGLPMPIHIRIKVDHEKLENGAAPAKPAAKIPQA